MNTEYRKNLPGYLVTLVVLEILTVVISFVVGHTVGKSDGKQEAFKEAYKTNPPSEQLELVCVGLWIGEQNKKYWERENASNTK